MKVKVIEAFRDKETGVDYKVDSIFECSDERGAELIEYGLVALEEKSKSNESLKSKEAKLVEKEAILNDKEESLSTIECVLDGMKGELLAREEAISTKEAELVALQKVLKSKEKDLGLREEKLKKAEPKDKK